MANLMEEKIHEIMKQSDKQPFDYDVCREIAIGEIADIFRKFTEWLLSARDMQTRISIDKLFIYWWNNIKDK